MSGSIDEVTKDVFVARGTAVNWVILREGDELTLVDGGFPGDLKKVLSSIEEIGHSPSDVRAGLGTHAHVDHIGAFEYFTAELGVPVYMSAIDAYHAHTGDFEQATPLDLAKRIFDPRMLPWLLSISMVGGASHPTLSVVHSLDMGAALDVPGRPVPVSCSGHSSGHTAFHLPGAGVVLAGDALATGHPLSPLKGPQLLPDFFAADADEAVRELDNLAGLAADILVCGHGEPWKGTPADAVDLARSLHEA